MEHVNTKKSADLTIQKCEKNVPKMDLSKNQIQPDVTTNSTNSTLMCAGTPLEAKNVQERTVVFYILKVTNSFIEQDNIKINTYMPYNL